MQTRLTLLVTFVAVVSVGAILLLVRRRQLAEKYAILWLGVGSAAVLAAIFRPLLDPVSLALGIASGTSLVFLIVSLFLMAVAAHLSWEVSRLEERTRALAEELALLDARLRQPPSGEHEQEG